MAACERYRLCLKRWTETNARGRLMQRILAKGLSQNKCINISSELIHLELMVDIDAVKRRFESLLPAVDERVRRLIAAAESLAIDYGGISIVSLATAVSTRPFARGIVEL